MNKNLIIGALCMVSAAVGGVTGYFVAKKQLSTIFETRLAEEIEATKKHYSVLYKKGPYSDIESARKELQGEVVPNVEESARLQEAVEALRNYSGGQPLKVDYAKTVRVFQETPVEEITEDLIRNRTEEAPYIIGKEEFLNGEKEFVQVTLTYFVGDKVLIDEQQRVMDDVDETVGEDNLNRFGQGSKDPNVVYVRNDALELEFEILRSEGKYSEEVLDFRD